MSCETVAFLLSSAHRDIDSMMDDSSNIVNGSGSSGVTPNEAVASGVLDATHAPAPVSSKDVSGVTMPRDVTPNHPVTSVPGEKGDMAYHWTLSTNRHISSVFSPLIDSAAAPARPRRGDYVHLDVDEPQREGAARTSLPEQQPFTTVVSLSNASANDSLIMDASSCGGGSTILGFALRAAAELNTLGLPPSAFISTNSSAVTNIISGEDGTHASAVVSTNVTGSTDVIFGEIVALHVVPIVYLILVTQARSTQLP